MNFKNWFFEKVSSKSQKVSSLKFLKRRRACKEQKFNDCWCLDYEICIQIVQKKPPIFWIMLTKFLIGGDTSQYDGRVEGERKGEGISFWQHGRSHSHPSNKKTKQNKKHLVPCSSSSWSPLPVSSVSVLSIFSLILSAFFTSASSVACWELDAMCALPTPPPLTLTASSEGAAPSSSSSPPPTD